MVQKRRLAVGFRQQQFIANLVDFLRISRCITGFIFIAKTYYLKLFGSTPLLLSMTYTRDSTTILQTKPMMGILILPVFCTLQNSTNADAPICYVNLQVFILYSVYTISFILLGALGFQSSANIILSVATVIFIILYLSCQHQGHF